MKSHLTLIALLCSCAVPVVALAQSVPPSPGLLFHVGGEQGTTADRAGGLPSALFAQGVRKIPDGVRGAALRIADGPTLAWAAPGNMFAQRGTLSFFLRPVSRIGTAPFPIFRAGAGDGTSWDMTFLRIDWNGHGFDAFVTDTNASRIRVSTSQTAPAADHWTHIAFAWDETRGVTLWIDGKRVADKLGRSTLDQALFGFGPFQRVVSPQKVGSDNTYTRAGDLDEIWVFDHMLDDADVAALARNEALNVPAATTPGLGDAGIRSQWDLRYGWDRIAGRMPDPAGSILSVRKVEFADTRDQKEKAFRGADGIRETAWPGTYNRSKLAGRTDYFVLPDWNVYSTGGREYTLTLLDEQWNHLELIGAAPGTVRLGDATIFERGSGGERDAVQLTGERAGGTLVFRSDAPETPLQEIAAYRIGTTDALPAAFATLRYRIEPRADPAGYASLATAVEGLAGRFPAEERSAVVALPGDATMIARGAGAPARGLPVAHILIPPTFRDQAPGGSPRRSSYGWKNLDAGLDGVTLDLPPLALSPGADGLAPLNIRLHDPLWPDRDLIDVTVRVRPKQAQTIWLDSRDRILPPDLPIALTIAANDAAFGAQALAGATVGLRFKPRDAAIAEHVADRLEQARDNLASLIEERPGTTLYPVWDRFERDVSDVLRVDPGNAKALSLWAETNPEQPGPSIPALAPPPPGVPEWAFRQTEALSQYRRFIDWWIDHRQIANGELGGGLSDDTDMVNQWVGLALMGVEPDRLRRSQRAVLDATIANGMWDKGLSAIQTDQLHVYEEGINALAQAMMLDWGDPALIERAMEVARNYPRLMPVNAAGHAHFASAWYSGSKMEREDWLGWQYAYSFLVTHPGMLLVDYNGASKVRSTLLGALDGWLAHGKQDEAGNWRFPQEIEWATDRERGNGVASAAHNFWAAYRWTGDSKYLRPLLPRGLTEGSAATLFGLNADVLSQLPGGDALSRRIGGTPGSIVSTSNDPNLGTVSDAERAQYVRWQETGDNALLARLYSDAIRLNARRWYVLTEAEAWTDRVAVPSELLQRARMGGVALTRNNYDPGNLVSWRFTEPDIAEQVGILIPRGDPRRFRVIAFNLSDAPVTATMVGGMLTPGKWSMTSEAEAANAPQKMEMERGSEISLVLPSKKTVIFDFNLVEPEAQPATRPDIGISAEDLILQGQTLSVRVHSLGAIATPGGVVTAKDANGATIGTARFPALAAPGDLVAKTHLARLRLSKEHSRSRIFVSVALDKDAREISARNNHAQLAVGTAAGDHRRGAASGNRVDR